MTIENKYLRDDNEEKTTIAMFHELIVISSVAANAWVCSATDKQPCWLCFSRF